MVLAYGSYGPNLSATSDSSGTCLYWRVGIFEAPVVITPGFVGWWAFPAYNHGGVDFAGQGTRCAVRCVVEGPGTITVHTASYNAEPPRSLHGWLRHFDAGTGHNVDEQEHLGAHAGDDFVFTVPDDGHATHYVDVTDDLEPPDAGASKFGFAGFDWEGPSPLVLADWDGNGFGDFGSADDLTDDVASWRITRGSSPEITGGSEPGSLTLVLNNPEDDRYNPLNVSGPLYGKLRDGVPVWVGIAPDGTGDGIERRGLFGGRITDITPVPLTGADICPTVEIVATDCLGWYGRVPVQLAHSTSRTQAALRAALLTSGGETRVSLPQETATLVISSADGSLLEQLEAINHANGTRHFCRPEDDPDDWYTYVALNRQHGLRGVADAALDDGSVGGSGRGITGSDGWRLSADTVTNQQRATVSPIVFTLGPVVVWEAGNVPIRVSAGTPRVFWMEFDDVVRDPVLNMNWTGTTPSTNLEAFGATARLTITSAGTTDISRLQVEGRLARRAEGESHVANDLASQAPPRGIREGSEISGDFIGVLANARGMAEHVVWRYGTPQLRPTVTVQDWMPFQFEVDLFDLVSMTVAALGMASRLFEVVGVTHVCTQRPVHTTTYVLQECRVQADPGWFILDVSLLDGPDLLAY